MIMKIELGLFSGRRGESKSDDNDNRIGFIFREEGVGESNSDDNDNIIGFIFREVESGWR